MFVIALVYRHSFTTLVHLKCWFRPIAVDNVRELQRIPL